jgi:hypothetical protein
MNTDQGMPRLRELRLELKGPVESLSFLSAGTLPQSLTVLTTDLSSCHQLSLRPSELTHVNALRQLRKLTMYQSLSSPLSAATRALYQPPSALLPALNQFWYSAI